MSSEPKTLSVMIFGSEYKIKGADPAYIQEVAAYVDGKMRELEGRLATGTPTKIAILTSMNVADELFRQRDELARLEAELRERAQRLERALGECLGEACPARRRSLAIGDLSKPRRNTSFTMATLPCSCGTRQF